MANSVALLVRCTKFQLCKGLVGCVGRSIITPQVRCLYSKTVLGIEAFIEQKERVQNQFGEVSDKFVQKMKEFTSEGSKAMVFTEDLKNMMHLADSEEDINLVIKMMKQFSQQNSQLRFGNFIFGPVAMRMFHFHNKPDLAIECFKAPELNGFFDQLISYQILLDLLYENKKYNEVLEAFELIKAKQIEGMKYPKNAVVLVYASLYKMNTKESLDKALKLWKELNEVGHFPMRRACTFCAGLALNQNEPAIALEVVSQVKNQGYTSVRNIKALALSNIGRVEDVIPILKSILQSDVPHQGQVPTFNTDVLEKVKSAVEKLNKPDITAEFDRLYKLFKSEGHVSELTLDQQLCSEIVMAVRPDVDRRRTFDRFPPFQRSGDVNRRPTRINSYNNTRPGLADLQ